MKAILGGERDSLILAGMRDHRCKNSVETIARSLCGNYRQEHLSASDRLLICMKIISRTNSGMRQEIIAQFISAVLPINPQMIQIPISLRVVNLQWTKRC